LLGEDGKETKNTEICGKTWAASKNREKNSGENKRTIGRPKVI
jgi:hypothetical protein